MEYLAHLDKDSIKQTIKEHSIGVAQASKNQVPNSINFRCIDNEQLKELAYIMGYFHDIGKYSSYFQEYIKNGIDNKLKMHAHISACFAYNLLNERLRLSDEVPGKSILLFLIYLSVRLHHDSLYVNSGLFPRGNLENMWQNLELIRDDLLKNRYSIVGEIKSIVDTDQFTRHLNLSSLRNNTGNFIYLPQWFKSGRNRECGWFFLLIYIFSLLIDNDKLNSAGIAPSYVKRIDTGKVQSYLKRKNKGKRNLAIFGRREKARASMLGVIDALSDDDIREVRFFILNGPTGIGKTLSSLECVMKLKARIESICGYSPRIITAIPFINIIEQSKIEYENVFEEDAKLIVHHRLSDFTKIHGSDETQPLEKLLSEVESWDGDVILTTFVQFFHSIFTGNNRSLKKINKLAGSIVILDEAQSVPEDYMPLIGAVLQMIADYYGTRFVLMTATQPKLLEFGALLLKGGSPRTIQLLPDCKEYFDSLTRTRFVPMLDKKIDSEEFFEIFFNRWDVHKSALVVVNTIKRSIDIYKGMKERLKEQGNNTPIYYLSTNIVPIRRKKVIKEVKEILDSGEPVILISTQTIEAGVDLDFDMAFRDLAPIDSLIQTAGRVNREGKKGDYLPVYIVRLGSDNQYIYELQHRDSTLKLLPSKKEFKEDEYFQLTDEYYNLALERGVSEKSRKIWEDGILKLDFEEIEKFQLIEKREQVCDVFVEMDENASNLADAFESVLLNKDYMSEYVEKALGLKMQIKDDIFARKALIKLICGKMNDYTVQIRISTIVKNRPIEFSNRGGANSSDLFWIPLCQIEDYYDVETGFISEDGRAFMY